MNEYDTDDLGKKPAFLAKYGAGIAGAALLAALTCGAFALTYFTTPPGPASTLARPEFFIAFGFITAVAASIVARLMRIALGREPGRKAEIHYVDDRA